MRAWIMVALLALTGCRLRGGSPHLPGQAEIHDGDHDGYVLVDDCNDEDSSVHPDANERCDGIDNDCDGEVDGPEAVDGVEYWADADADGFGAGTPTVSCTQPSGMVDNGLDCDDSRAEVNPAVTEYCGDSIDNDCDAGTTCSWDGEAATTSADATIVADFPEGGLGVDIAGAGDIDGDGVGDLVLGSWNEAAFLFLGPVTSTSTDHASATLTGVVPHHGRPVLGIDDQAGDGYADIAVSAPGSTDAGRVYVISGPISGTMTADSVASTIISGVGDDSLGNTTGTGDVDGDGVSDLLASAPGTRDDESYVFRGPVAGGDLSSAESDVTISGGWIDGVGDVDGDGIADVTILSPPSGTSGWLVLGPVTVDRSATSGDVEIATPTPAPLDALAVATAGDLDDDGINDLAMAAPLVGEPGAVWIVSGPTAAATEKLDALSAAMLTVRGADYFDLFGWALDTSSDFDGDGADDLVVTAPGYYYKSGAAFVFYGPSSGTLSTADADFRIWGELGEYAGVLARYPGDLDGDGVIDLALRSAGFDDAHDSLVTLWYGGPR